MLTTEQEDFFIMAKKDEEEKGVVETFLLSIGFGPLDVRGFNSLIRQKKFKQAKEQYPKEYKKYIQDKRKKPKIKSKGGYSTKKRTGSMDYRKGGMVLSTVDNRKK